MKSGILIDLLKSDLSIPIADLLMKVMIQIEEFNRTKQTKDIKFMIIRKKAFDYYSMV